MARKNKKSKGFANTSKARSNSRNKGFAVVDSNPVSLPVQWNFHTRLKNLVSSFYSLPGFYGLEFDFSNEWEQGESPFTATAIINTEMGQQFGLLYAMDDRFYFVFRDSSDVQGIVLPLGDEFPALDSITHEVLFNLTADATKRVNAGVRLASCPHCCDCEG